jgi:hypothetical protein
MDAMREGAPEAKEHLLREDRRPPAPALLADPKRLTSLVLAQ